MTYQELKDVVQDLHTQAPLSSRMGILTKMVLNKIARKRPNFTRREAVIEVNGNTEIDLSSRLPDLIAVKKDVEKGKDISYSMGSSTHFFTMASYSKYKDFEYDNYAAIYNNKLYLPKGRVLPEKIYIPYFSKNLVLDKDGETEKEKPENSDDSFLLDSVFEDVLVDGLLLYLKQRELDNSEYNKAKAEWEKSLQQALLQS